MNSEYTSGEYYCKPKKVKTNIFKRADIVGCVKKIKASLYELTRTCNECEFEPGSRECKEFQRKNGYEALKL